VCLLQEVDLNARRSGRRNVAEVIAAELGLNYIYGIAFEELSQGSGSARAFQGQVILTWGDFHSPRVHRFRRQSDYWRRRWFLPNWQVFQARDGGRMAIAAELQLGRDRLAVYNLHLESKGHDELRVAQLMDVLHDCRQYPPETAVVIAGDLNTRRDPSPLRDTLRASGFHDACDSPDCRSTKPNGQRLDWIAGRGPLKFSRTTVHQDVTASDHYPLSTDLLLRQ
jgi:endonuclease/exonuclease/phosphatase family metal-dependent hydrolase